jgi:CRISPR-associated protein Cas2
MRRRYLVSYDVADDKRRDLIFKKLRDQGDHAQYSVFFCELTLRELIALKFALQAVLHHTEDQIMILDLGPATHALGDSLEVLGKPYEPPGPCFVV